MHCSTRAPPSHITCHVAQHSFCDFAAGLVHVCMEGIPIAPQTSGALRLSSEQYYMVKVWYFGKLHLYSVRVCVCELVSVSFQAGLAPGSRHLASRRAPAAPCRPYTRFCPCDAARSRKPWNPVASSSESLRARRLCMCSHRRQERSIGASSDILVVVLRAGVAQRATGAQLVQERRPCVRGGTGDTREHRTVVAALRLRRIDSAELRRASAPFIFRNSLHVLARCRRWHLDIGHDHLLHRALQPPPAVRGAFMGQPDAARSANDTAPTCLMVGVPAIVMMARGVKQQLLQRYSCHGCAQGGYHVATCPSTNGFVDQARTAILHYDLCELPALR